jgi:uncharacterized protein YlxW (UPF0749 family)
MSRPLAAVRAIAAALTWSHRHGRASGPVDRRRTVWNAGVLLTALAAGLLFAASASSSGGTGLRSTGNDGLVGLVRNAQRSVQKSQSQAQALQDQIKAATDRAAGSNDTVAAAQHRVDSDSPAAGLTAARGAGLVVVLDDSHDPVPPSVDANATVVHQSDLQSVINALWSGGAEAVSLAGQRLISTSAVRCVGNTLLLNGQLYSPPFRVQAIGPGDEMRKALDASPGVALYRQAADVLGLTYKVNNSNILHLPAYDGSIIPHFAKVIR